MEQPQAPRSESAVDGMVERNDVTWRRRLMAFGESIRSDMDNPLATSWRAIMRALTRAGHEVVFIEPRRSDSLTHLLRHRGSAPLRRFAEVYPDLQYRTLDLPRGRELSLWLARELALLDAVVVLDNASEETRSLIAAYDEPRLVRFLSSVSGEPVTGSGDRLDLDFDPAIDIQGTDPGPIGTPERPRLAVLAWDAEQASLATQVWHIAERIDAGATRLSLGSLSLDGWQPVTELDLAAALARIDVAVVIAGLHPAGPARSVRSLLPWSFGVRAVTVAMHVEGSGESLAGPVVTLDELPEQVGNLAWADWPDLSRWSADDRAARLVAAIDRSRAAQRADRS